MKVCSVTVDVDCLRSNFKGFGLRKNSYSFKEFETGIENLLAFFFRFNIRATFFFVAQDLEIKTNAELIKYVIAERIKLAKAYLNEGEKIFIVSERVGYKNHNYFAKLFKNLTGMTPGEYRRAHSVTKIIKNEYKHDLPYS